MEIVRQKNVATYITFPLVDADGDPVSSATGLDSNIDAWADSSNPDGFAACSNEATEIGSTGSYYLSLTQTEMNQDYLIIYIASNEAKTQWVIIRTMVGDPLLIATTALGALIWSVATRAITDKAGFSIASGGFPADGFVANAITAAAIASNAIDSGAIANNAITATAITDGSFTAAKFAANAITSTILAADSITGTQIEDGTITAAKFATNAITSGIIADNAITAAKINDNAITAAKIATDAIGSDEFAQGAADKVWSTSTRSLTDKAGFTISGTTQTFDALDTLLDSGHGAGSWLTGAAGGAMIQVIPSIPKNIDLSDTKTVRIALYVTDMIDDLPTTIEIIPGTIKIERSADGGTSWTTIVNDEGCSDHAGGLYYDEVFDSGSGYVSGDMIKITFKGQKCTISANDHEIADGTDGMVFITRIDSGGPNTADIADAVWDEDIEGAHGGDTSAGLLLRVLGSAISDRSFNATLDALLGVADSSGVDLPEQVWSEGTRALTDKAGFTISGTTQTFDALDTLLDSAHGAGSWLTGGGGAGANILVLPSIPKNIDLADTKTVRIALWLTDQNDDLPTTGEITPGTIKIERSADGGTSWSTIRDDVACSEQAGGIYYDEVFSSGNGYASADMIQITFKGQKVTISANDHEIADGTLGIIFTTRIDSGLSGGGPSAGDIADAVWDENIESAHGGDAAAGLLLRVLGSAISDRSNNPTLNALLGVPDSAGVDIPEQVWAEGTRALTDKAGFTISGGVLTTPNDYKADVSALATESNATTNTASIITEVDANETKIDSIISDTDRLRYRGSVWIDDTAANTNTVLGTDGVPENPVSTLAAALIIASALNVQSLTLMNNSSISLSQSFANWEIIGFGHDNIVTLNSQNIDNIRLYNVQVTGTQGGTISALFDHCHLDSIVGLNAHAIFSHFIGNSTLVASNSVFFFDYCSSTVAGNNTPIITFSAGTTGVSFRHYSGGIEIKGMTVDHTMSYESDGQIIINADCTGGALTLRGNMTITDNSGNVTITEGAALNRDVIADAVWDEILTGATHNLDTSAGKRLRQLEEGLVIDSGVIQGATASTITLAGTASSVTDFYMHCLCVITSGTGIGQARRIDTYNGTSNVADILIDWATTPVNGDEYQIITDDAQHVIHLHQEGLDQIGDAVWNEIMSGHVVSGSAGEIIRRLIGLNGEFLVAEYTFDVDDNITLEFWQYDTLANFNTHNKSTGLIGSWVINTTFSSGKPTVAKSKRLS